MNTQSSRKTWVVFQSMTNGAYPLWQALNMAIPSAEFSIMILMDEKAKIREIAEDLDAIVLVVGSTISSKVQSKKGLSIGRKKEDQKVLNATYNASDLSLETRQWINTLATAIQEHDKKDPAHPWRGVYAITTLRIGRPELRHLIEGAVFKLGKSPEAIADRFLTSYMDLPLTDNLTAITAEALKAAPALLAQLYERKKQLDAMGSNSKAGPDAGKASSEIEGEGARMKAGSAIES